MVISCDSCSVSLQLDESKIPSGNFTVRCPRCQNLIRVQKDASGQNSSTVQQLAANQPAPVVSGNEQEFAAREAELQINSALKSLLSALQKESKSIETDEISGEKPRRVLLCLGQHHETVAKLLSDAGYKVYLAQTPAQANERMREGKTEIVIFSPDFASEYGGAAILQQKFNSMSSFERRQHYLVSLENEGTTMSAEEAFTRNLNLIINTKDIPQLPLILNRALRDYNELYYYFNQAAGVEAL